MSGRSRAAQLAASAAALVAAAALAALELATPGVWPARLQAVSPGMPALAGGGLILLLALAGWILRGSGPAQSPEEEPPC
ncbi:MAG: hypothetical protein K2P95_05475 [Hyphomonadaceae bacterium]|nr:hypothetical protein [Hyphomonadaceae bacterium]